MVKIVILNDTRNSNKDKFENDDGFSAYIEIENNKILFDAGPSEKFMKNAEKLGIDLNQVNTIVLSHGHYDHGDGLKYFNNKVEFIAHPNCTLKRWWKDDHSHYSGIQLTKEELENKYNVHFTKEPYKINQNTYYLGEITRKYPVQLKKWVLENGENDDVLDDSGMVINTENGIIVIAGCSHSGICNIVEQAKKVSNNSKVLAVIGGFHLREVDENTNKVVDYMKNNVKEVILAHCIAKELGVSPQYVSKVLKGHPNYKKEKEIRSEIKHKNYLETKRTTRQLRTKILKEKEDYELEYLRHLQWQHAIEMSKKYLV